MNPFPKNPNKLEEEAQQEKELLEFLKSNPEIMKKYQQEVNKMQSQKTKSASIHPPMTSSQYQSKVKDQTIEQFLDEEGGLVIQPQKGIVLKLFDKNSGQKIFVNVVKHMAVDHPEEKVLVDLENQAGLRIPMSMGRVREDNDKKGVPCKTVDVVMNSKIVETAEINADIFFFMAQIISNYLLQKYKISVAQDKVTKVNLKYKGTNVQIQRIKAKKSPKIEEVPSQQQKSKQQQQEQERLLSGLSEHASNKLKQPDFKVFGIIENGERQQYSLQIKGLTKSLEIELDLSLLIHSRGIHLEANDRVLYLYVKGLYESCLRLPEPIQNYNAKFGRRQRILKVFCEVKQPENVVSQQKVSTASKPVNIKIQSSLLDQLV